MSEKKKIHSSSSEESIDLIVGIVTIVAILGLFAWLFIAAARNNRALGIIASTGELRRGSEQQFTCEVTDESVKDGEKVVWSVNGEKVAESEYKAGETLTFAYTPEATGRTTVSVKVGRYRRTEFVDVLPPQLTLTAPSLVVTYGDELPEMKFACDGFVCGDSLEDSCYDGTCAIAEYANCGENGGKLNAGVYKIEFDKPCQYKDYEVHYVYGTLTVLPKQLQVASDISKVYDQTNYVENVNLKLLGVEEDDNVTAKCDKLYFDNKNVGEHKAIMLSNVELVGEGSKNYCLPTQTRGKITPKKIELTGMVVQDKVYDGTTRAQVEKAGTLDGVIDGDSVAIGSLEVHFDEAYVGQREVVCDNVTLIGLDKDNYEVSDVEPQTAEITPY